MNLRCKLSLVLLITGYTALQAQLPDVLPSPNASAMIRFSNIQIGHYTGVPNISVPFGQLPGRDISIPVSLDYHASGIKVQDVASSVGLGWNLNAGGAITRVVRGIPDGLDTYCGQGTLSDWYNISELCDGERDIFYFNFLGRSGKMFLDDSGVPQTMPYQDISITSGLSGTSPWIITDESGYKYYFGENAGEREAITYYTADGASYDEKYTYISTWYLKRIVAPTGVEVATFTYYTGSDFEYLVYNDVRIGSVEKSTNTKVKVKQAKYLNTISTSIATVRFNYLTIREDLTNGWQLNTIEFRDQSNSPKRKFYLVLDYFKCGFGNTNQRLRLSSIREGLQSPVTTFSFSYHEKAYFNENSLNPLRSDFNLDDYGYYNGGSNLSCHHFYRVADDCNDSGVDKSPASIDYRRVFTLNEIQKIGGDRTLFEFENADARGLRIKSISKFNSTDPNPVAKSSFSYSEGQGFNAPVYQYTTEDGTKVTSSSSFKDLFDLSGTTIGYSTVVETFLDNSKIVREFYNFSDYADTDPVVTKYKQTLPNLAVNKGSRNVNGVPFALPTTKFWMRGLPKRVRVYDNENHVLRMDEWSYGEGPVISTVTNTAVHLYKYEQGSWGNGDKITYISGVYNLESRPVVLGETKSYTYSQDGYANSILEKNTFTYHSNTVKTFPNSVTRQVGSGPEEKVTFRYPADVEGSGIQSPDPQPLADGIRAMVSNHIIVPIEKINWFKDIGSSSFKIIGAELKGYRKNSVTLRPVLSTVYSLVLENPISSLSPEASLTSNKTVFSFDTRYRLINTFDFDNATSTLTSTIGSDGLTTDYQWIYNTLPSSVIINPGSNQFKKDFVYNTIYGITLTTDENGQNTSLEYDPNFGQVRILRDQDNNIVKRYRYHYKNQPESLTNAVITASGNGCVTFSSPEHSSAGQITYYWDFGDGTTSITTGPVSHGYFTPGTYVVKLKKESTEYYSITTSRSVTTTLSCID